MRNLSNMEQGENDQPSGQNQHLPLGDISMDNHMEGILHQSVDNKNKLAVPSAKNTMALLMNSQKEEVFDIIDDSTATESEKASMDLKSDLILETNLLLMLMASALALASVAALVFHFYVSARVFLITGILHLWGPGLVASVLMFRWTSRSFRIRTRYAVLVYEMINRCLFTGELLVIDSSLAGELSHAAPFWAVMALHGLFLICFGVYSSAKNIRCCISIATLFGMLAIGTLGFGLLPSHSYQDLAETGLLKPLTVLAVLLGMFVLSSLVVVSFRFKSNNSSLNSIGRNRKETLEQRNFRLKNMELEQKGNLPLGLMFFCMVSDLFASFFLLDNHLRPPHESKTALVSSVMSLVLLAVFLAIWRSSRQQINLSVAASFGFNLFRRRVMLRDGPVMQQVSPTFFAPAASPPEGLPEEIPDLELGLRKSSTDSAAQLGMENLQSALSCDRGIREMMKPVEPKLADSILPLSADRASSPLHAMEEDDLKKKKLTLSKIAKLGKKLSLGKSQLQDSQSPGEQALKKEEESEDVKCHACMAQRMEILMLPCNHAMFCRKCLDLHIKTTKETAASEEEDFQFICPVCRGQIVGVCRFDWLDTDNKQFKITEDLTSAYKHHIANSSKAR